MSLMDIFRKEQTSSASVAKERLRVLVAHDRLRNNGPEYLPQLQQEILAVIRKYSRSMSRTLMCSWSNKARPRYWN